MATALLDTNVQDRVSALRGRVAASRERASSMFSDLRQQANSVPPGINEVIAGIRGKIAMSGDDVSIDANPNPGLPMMAGTTSKQKI
ncbi:MAG: hypothetical protein ACK502_09145 [Alphaproteobacteria bacterium]